jgi:hypothetical protein
MDARVGVRTKAINGAQFPTIEECCRHVLVEVKEGGNWPAWPHQLRLRIVCEIENEVVQCKARYEEVGRRQGCDDAAL